MLYAVWCQDEPNQGELRADTRPAHLAYLKRHADHVVTAGPLLDEAGAVPVGSLFILDFLSRAELDRFLEQDPYAEAGLFEATIVKPWRRTLPEEQTTTTTEPC